MTLKLAGLAAGRVDTTLTGAAVSAADVAGAYTNV
jgi:hypothetical protein